jgi:hypothetical protein
MLIEIAELTGMNRFTVTKYIHELMGSGSVFQKQAAAARMCYLKESFSKNKGTSKMNIFLLISTMILIGVITPKSVSAVIEIDNCTVLDSPNEVYLLNASISNSPNTTCMDIIVENVTLDCQGNSIDGNDISNSYGILSNAFNTSVKNCNLSDWDDSIYYNSSDDSLIYNVSVTSQFSSYDYTVHILNSHNNKVKNLTIISDLGTAYWGILIINSNNTLLKNITVNVSSRAIFISTSYNTHVSESNLYGTYDAPVDIWPTLWVGDYVCDHTFTDVMGPDNKPILFYNNTNVKIENWNNNFSEIILCNVDQSVINNITFSDNYGIKSWGIDNSNYSNIHISDISLQITPLFFRFGGSNKFTNITAENVTSSISFWESDSNILTNVISRNNTYGIYFGYNCNYNTIMGGSFHDNIYDYYIIPTVRGDSNFTSTNFTGIRTIYLGRTQDGFNYNDEIDGNIWLRTNFSLNTSTITRELITWSRSLIQWNDTNISNPGPSGIYKITGLFPNSYYNIYNDSVLTYNLSTDSDGVLPEFTINLVNGNMIRIQEMTPLWRNQTTNDTDSLIKQGEAINLSSQGYDETGLDWAWLATNETGIWKNRVLYEYTQTDIEDSYRCEGFLVTNCSNMADENWDTYAYSWESVSMGLYENYTLNYQKNEITQIKIQAKVLASGTGFPSSIHCWNHSGNNWLELIEDDADSVTILNVTNTSSEIKDCLSDTNPFMILVDCQTGSGNSRIYESNITEYAAFKYETNMSGISKTWAWSNYTWLNSSTPQLTTVGWRIYYNDTSGNQNSTDIMTFTIKDTNPPSWLNNNSQLVATYTPIGYSNFSIIWNDNSGNTFAYLEHNFTGNLENVSMSGTYPNFYYNSSSLAAKTYQFRFIGNDSYGNENSTEIQIFSINKNSCDVDLWLNSGLTDQDNTIIYPTQANATTSINLNGINWYLERNGSQVDTGSGYLQELIILGSGIYNYTGYWEGNENYTSCYEQSYLTINQNQTNPVDLIFRNSTGEYKNQNMTIFYGEQSNTTGLTVYSNSGTISLYRDGQDVTSTENSQLTTLPVNENGYAYKTNTTGNQNYTANSTGITYYLIVKKAPSTIELFLNDTNDDRSFMLNDVINITVVLTIPNETNEILYIDINTTGWITDSGSNPHTNITQMPEEKTYNVTGYWFGNQNYTSTFTTHFININDSTMPQYSNIINSPVSPTIYLPNKFYQFNISWIDNFKVDTVIFEWNNTNTTVNTYFGSEYFVNRTDISGGNYFYKWYANDTNDNWNSTNLLTYTVNRNTRTINTTFDKISPQPYGTGLNVSCIVSNGTNDGSITLYRNSTNVTSTEMNVLTILPAGNWEYTCNISSGVNYTNASGVGYFTIDRVTPSGHQTASPAWTNNYGTETNVSCYLDVGDNETSLTLERETFTVATGVQPFEVIILGGGSYNYTCRYPGSQNYSSSILDSDILTINRLSTSTKLYINGSDTDRNFKQGVTVNFTVTVDVSGKLVKLYTNFTGWNIPSGVTPLYNYTILNYDDRTYNITGYFEGDQNYSSSSETHFLTINPIPLVTINLNASSVWWGGSINVSGIAKRSDQSPLSNIEVKLTFDGETICSNIPNTTSTGWYSCVFNTPYRIGTRDVQVYIIDPVTSEPASNTSSLEVKVWWGGDDIEMDEAANVGCYEVPKIIQNPDGSIRRVLVKMCVWK